MLSPKKSILILHLFGFFTILVMPYLQYVSGNTARIELKLYLVVIFIETLIFNLLRFKISDQNIKKWIPVFIIIVVITFYFLK